MKKFTLFISIFAICASMTFAQSGNVTTATTALTSGKLDVAKTAIDEAIEHEKTKDDQKAWLAYARVYQAIHEHPMAIYKNLDEKALDKAYAAYLKAEELGNTPDQKGKVKNKVHKDVLFNLSMANPYAQIDARNTIRNDYLTEGITSFNNKDYVRSAESFINVLTIDAMPEFNYLDTAVIYNTALACYNGELYEKSIPYFQKTAELDNEKGGDMYYYIATAYKNMGNTDKFLETLEAGIVKFPNSNNNLLIEMVNYYLNAGDSKKALIFLDKAIEKDPKNHTFYFAKGTLYDKYYTTYDSIALANKADAAKFNENKTKSAEAYQNAIDSYKKSIELDETYLNSAFNLGVLIYNNGVAIEVLAQDIPPKETKRYDEEMAKAKVKYTESLPYLEKAFEIDKKEPAVLQALSTIYVKLQMYDKSKEIKALLDEL